MSSRQDVEFASRGATLRGWLYLAEGEKAKPGIVVAHGFTAVREMFLDRYGEAFSAAGFTTLVYDHFGFGASDGEPRQFPAASVQLDGYRDAISWLRQQDYVDAGSIGIWGTSRSGGLVVALAAEDLPIRCAFAQVPGFGRPGLQLSAVTVAAITDALGSGRLDAIVPATSETADGMGLMFPDDAHRWMTRVSRERAPSWRNEVRVGALAEKFYPVDTMGSVKVPLRLLVAPADKLTPPQAGMEAAAGNPLIDVIQVPGGHFDAYEAGFPESSRRAIEWFARHLRRA